MVHSESCAAWSLSHRERQFASEFLGRFRGLTVRTS